MWLVVLAPLVTQLVLASRSDDPARAALCSAFEPASAHAHGVRHGDPLAACGYCDLLADHPAMPTLPALTLTLAILLAIPIVPALSIRFTPLGAFSSGRPRGPPAFLPLSV